MTSPILLLDVLRVDVAALRRRGVDQHEVQASLPVPWLRQALRDTDAEVEHPGAVSLQLWLQPEGVVVAQGALRLGFSVPCGRCLSPAAVDGGTEIFATYMPSAAAGEVADADGDDLDPDQTPDVWGYDGPILSVEPMVAEQVALAYPMRALCERGDLCRGLCSNCGYELNVLAVEVRQCPQCKGEVPLTPVADLPEEGGQARDKRESALAAALRGIELK